MKILSIGNSFSTDAHRYLHKLASLHGYELETANLFIGGCSLEMHWQNATEDNPFYDYEINGNEAETKISILSALKKDKWDVITLQQVSHMSGLIDTYEPYLSSLVKLVKQFQPQAKLYFHQTWSYEKDSLHEGFLKYNRDQKLMYNHIISVSQKAAQSINAEIIPTGKVIQYLRENTSDFDYENGGISLCRDSFHLSFDYGRFAAAATWLRRMTGIKIEVTEFENFDKNLLQIIVDAVNRIV
ncbi:MAG: DUF4886 domain-containing protein [Clostridia bacterium]|nr:DUF4886 domain-containing protein [Clostridia bacterium]